MDKRKQERLQKVLSEEYENIVRALNRNRTAEEEILVEPAAFTHDLRGHVVKRIVLEVERTGIVAAGVDKLTIPGVARIDEVSNY